MRRVRASGVYSAQTRLNLAGVAADNAGVAQVNRPMQIALVAVVLLAGMWFTVLRPKGNETVDDPIPAQAAPGTAGLSSAVDKAKGAVASSQASADATQAAAAQASGEAAAPAPASASATPSATAGTPAAKAAAAKKAAADKQAAADKADPSTRLFPFLDKGKTVVLLFYGKGAEDAAARKAVRRTAESDKNVISAYAPIAEVGEYAAITTDVPVLTSPTVLVIGKDRKARTLDGFLEAATIKQAVGDVRRALKAAPAQPATP
jgi:hypothetical protein